MGELIQTLRSAYEGPEDPPTPINQKELQQRTGCPACLEVMETFPYYGPGNVVLDTCESCKLTWLNHGEFASIIRAPGFRGTYRPAKISITLPQQDSWSVIAGSLFM